MTERYGARVRRRDLLAAAAVGAGSLLLSTGVVAGDTTGDGSGWPQDRHDAANTGYNAGLQRSSDPVGVRPRWTFDAYDPEQPVVDGDTVYVSTDDELHALERGSGETQWVYHAESEDDISGLFVDSDAIYVFEREFDSDALRQVELRPEQGTARDVTELVGSSPAVADGTVYTTSETRTLADPDCDATTSFGETTTSCEVESETATLHAYDIETGSEQWSFQVSSETESVPEFGEPAATDDVVAVLGPSDEGRRLYAFDAETGAERWRFDPGETEVYSPAIAGDTIVTGQDRVYGLPTTAPDSGPVTPKWTFGDDNVVERFSRAAMDDGRVYLAGGGNVWALRAGDGAVEWQTTGPVFDDPQPTVAGGVVYVVDPGNAMYAFDAGTGERRWSMPGEFVEIPPVVVGYDPDDAAPTDDAGAVESAVYAHVHEPADFDGPPADETLLVAFDELGEPEGPG